MRHLAVDSKIRGARSFSRFTVRVCAAQRCERVVTNDGTVVVCGFNPGVGDVASGRHANSSPRLSEANKSGRSVTLSPVLRFSEARSQIRFWTSFVSRIWPQSLQIANELAFVHFPSKFCRSLRSVLTDFRRRLCWRIG